MNTSWIAITIGSVIGSAIPLMWGASELSFSSLLLGAVGALVALYLNFKMRQ